MNGIFLVILMVFVVGTVAAFVMNRDRMAAGFDYDGIYLPPFSTYKYFTKSVAVVDQNPQGCSSVAGPSCEYPDCECWKVISVDRYLERHVRNLLS